MTLSLLFNLRASQACNKESQFCSLHFLVYRLGFTYLSYNNVHNYFINFLSLWNRIRTWGNDAGWAYRSPLYILLFSKISRCWISILWCIAAQRHFLISYCQLNALFIIKVLLHNNLHHVILWKNYSMFVYSHRRKT